jgi:nucleoid-associated protein YgaU
MTLDKQADNQNKLVKIYQLQSVMQRMIKNLNLINSAPNSKIITVITANLFDLALKYYGDASYWVTIAEANQLTTNVINELTVLAIPPKPKTNPNGVYYL